MTIQVQEGSRTSNSHDKNRNSLWHIIVKTTSTENKERILKAVREKNQSENSNTKVNPSSNSRFLNKNIKRKKGME
jgi:hypothetical protein